MAKLDSVYTLGDNQLLEPLSIITLDNSSNKTLENFLILDQTFFDTFQSDSISTSDAINVTTLIDTTFSSSTTVSDSITSSVLIDILRNSSFTTTDQESNNITFNTSILSLLTVSDQELNNVTFDITTSETLIINEDELNNLTTDEEISESQTFTGSEFSDIVYDSLHSSTYTSLDLITGNVEFSQNETETLDLQESIEIEAEFITSKSDSLLSSDSLYVSNLIDLNSSDNLTILDSNSDEIIFEIDNSSNLTVVDAENNTIEFSITQFENLIHIDSFEHNIDFFVNQSDVILNYTSQLFLTDTEYILQQTELLELNSDNTIEVEYILSESSLLTTSDYHTILIDESVSVSLTLTDSETDDFSFGALLTDLLTLTETTSDIPDYLSLVNDPFSIFSLLFFEIDIAIQSFSDSCVFTDSRNINVVYLNNILNNLVLIDSRNIYLISSYLIQQPITFTEQLKGLLATYNHKSVEILQSTDSLSLILEYEENIFDFTQIMDLEESVFDSEENLMSTSIFHTNMMELLESPYSFLNNVNFTDSYIVEGRFSQNLQTLILLSDSQVLLADYTQIFNTALSVLDNNVANKIATVEFLNSITLSSFINTVVRIEVTFSDVVNINTSISETAYFFNKLTQNLLINDTYQVVLEAINNINQILLVFDYPSVKSVFSYMTSLSETLTFGENKTVSHNQFVSLVDSWNLLDSTLNNLSIVIKRSDVLYISTTTNSIGNNIFTNKFKESLKFTEFSLVELTAIVTVLNSFSLSDLQSNLFFQKILQEEGVTFVIDISADYSIKTL